MKVCAVWNEDHSVAIHPPPPYCLLPAQLTNDQNSSNICQGSLLSHDVTKLCSALIWWWWYSGIFVTAQKSVFPFFTAGLFFFFFFSCALRHTHQQVGMMEQKSSTPSPAHCNRQSFFLFCFFFFFEYCYSCFSLCFWVSGFWFKNTRHEVWMYESISKISKCGWCTSSMSRLPGLTCVFRSCVAQEGLYICKIRIRLWVMGVALGLSATYSHVLTWRIVVLFCLG